MKVKIESCREGVRVLLEENGKHFEKVLLKVQANLLAEMLKQAAASQVFKFEIQDIDM